MKSFPTNFLPSLFPLVLIESIIAFNFYFKSQSQNLTVISLFFLWIKGKVYSSKECGTFSFYFQANNILYFYPKIILKDKKLITSNNKEDLSFERCFDYFHISAQLDSGFDSFTCKFCDKRMKARSNINYIAFTKIFSIMPI